MAGQRWYKKEIRVNFQAGHDTTCTEISEALDVADASYNGVIINEFMETSAFNSSPDKMFTVKR